MVQVPDTVLPHKGSLSEDVMIITVGFVENRVLNSHSGLFCLHSVALEWVLVLCLWFLWLASCWESFATVAESRFWFSLDSLLNVPDFKSHRAWAGMLIVSSWPMLLIMENVLMLLFGLIQSMVFVYEIFVKSPGKAFLLPNIYNIFCFLIFFCLKQLFGPEFWVGSGSFTGYNDRYSHETSCVTLLT